VTPIKLIVTDLDMTLLRTDKSLSDYTKRVFARCAEQGILTAVATARYNIGAQPYIAALNPDYEITTDGTMVYCKGEFLFGDGFNLATTNHIIGEVKRLNPASEMTVATDACVYWNSPNIAASPVLHKAIYNDYSRPLAACAYKIVAEFDEAVMSQRIGAACGCRVVTYRGENRYGFIHAQAGKLRALQRLAAHLGVEMGAIVAFGDDTSDIDMLSACGQGIAVANATPAVKAIADAVCEANDEDGVARYIEDAILG